MSVFYENIMSSGYLPGQCSDIFLDPGYRISAPTKMCPPINIRTFKWYKYVNVIKCNYIALLYHF